MKQMTYAEVDKRLGERDTVFFDEGRISPYRPINPMSLYQDIDAHIETKEGDEKLENMSDQEMLDEFVHWHEELGCTYFQACWIIGKRLDGHDVDEEDEYEL